MGVQLQTACYLRWNGLDLKFKEGLQLCPFVQISMHQSVEAGKFCHMTLVEVKLCQLAALKQKCILYIFKFVE